MKALIEIPTENFGVDITDKFQDFFKRLQAEIEEHLISNTDLVCGSYELETIEMFLNAFKEMQIIPDNATNGDMIKAMFPNIEITYHNDNIELYNKNSISAEVLYQWWNEPYKRGNENEVN